MAGAEVLIVDDDDVMQEKLCRILSVHGYRTTVVLSGDQALELLGRKQFDCVILDYRLGDIDGLSLLSRVQAVFTRPCPVIMMTGLADERLIVEAMRRGAYDCVNKNRFQPEGLCSMVAAGMRWASLEAMLRESQQKLEQLSLYDSLTGLPNRNLFFARLERASSFAAQRNGKFALLMMDLNMFKDVNDTLGHAAGDAVLAEVGQRLKSLSRDADSFSRLGGDEFAGILLGVGSPSAAVAIAKRVISAIDAPFIIDGRLLSIGVSVGIAMFPEHGEDLHRLLAKADQAMYQAKRGSRGYVVCDGTGGGDRQDVVINGQLGEALSAGEFFLQYQPQIELQTGRCCGVEALARWCSPRLGEIPPARFIAIAERSAVITSMSYFFLEASLRQVRAWLDRGIALPVSVNLSAKLLDDHCLVEKALGLLERYRVPPKMLTLEITETALMGSPANAASVVRALAQAGVRVSLDDFGTGYTSFSHLRDFALSEIKIDKSFIAGVGSSPRDASIVEAFISLSKGFGVNLVAEGVEDCTSLVALRSLGCERAQGYGIGRPMPGDGVPGWIERWEAEREARFSGQGERRALAQ